jgi:hypothetical protein
MNFKHKVMTMKYRESLAKLMGVLFVATALLTSQPSIAGSDHPDIGAPPEMVRQAGQGNADAQFQLGFLYLVESGEVSGVARSDMLRAAAYWFGLSAEQGHEGAKKAYGMLAAYH